MPNVAYCRECGAQVETGEPCWRCGGRQFTAQMSNQERERKANEWAARLTQEPDSGQ